MIDSWLYLIPVYRHLFITFSVYWYLSKENDIISFVNENEAINYCNFDIHFWYEQIVFPWWVFPLWKTGLCIIYFRKDLYSYKEEWHCATPGNYKKKINVCIFIFKVWLSICSVVPSGSRRGLEMVSCGFCFWFFFFFFLLFTPVP